MIKIEQEQALSELKKSSKEFVSLFAYNNLRVEVYQPDRIDHQQPHEQDEFYLIIAGTGNFEMAGEIIFFKTGDFLFVPALTPHRFLNFSEDFVTWVFFVA
ncbi:cupin domain-containing protein [Gynurincola endophyticus]|uniref:cupin domain-containing protein n=1 Tax=Gynurincola endophyticus TaxID=2479004 RepID=UPI000F8D075A|nr:cupin domain-containing protein [Gynurincola endophyticus]